MVIPNIRKCVRPVVFDSRIPEYRFAIAGTCFLVGHKDFIFALTAKHVVRNTPVDRIVIFPAEGAKRAVPITRLWRAEDESRDPG